MFDKIGIGVCSYNRPKYATELCQQILVTVDQNKYQIKTVCSLDDTDTTGYEWIKDNFGLITAPNKGIAVNKNRLLKHLKDCDLVILVEDDVIFKKAGWLDLYIEAIKSTKYQHFNYIIPERRKSITEISRFDNGIHLGNTEHLNGVLMVLTKECIKQIGAFNVLFEKYGYEHADYTHRCMIKNLHPPKYCHLMEISDYIDYHDIPSAISGKMKEELMRKNFILFKQKIIFPFLPFSEKKQKAIHHLSKGPRFLLRLRNLIHSLIKSKTG